MEVLIDPQTIKGAAVPGEPWRYYDLGHGFCSYEFFDQCPHRMACARCNFYVPRQSAQADLIRSKSSMVRMLQEGGYRSLTRNVRRSTVTSRRSIGFWRV